MPDESAIVRKFLYEQLVNRSALVSILPRGVDAIDADIRPADTDTFFIILHPGLGVDEKVINRGARRQWTVFDSTVDVYGPPGSTFDDLAPLVSEVDLVLDGASGYTPDGCVDSCERVGLLPLPQYRGVLLVPRTVLRFTVIAQGR